MLLRDPVRQLLQQRWGAMPLDRTPDGSRKVLSANKSDARTVNGEHPGPSTLI